MTNLVAHGTWEGGMVKIYTLYWVNFLFIIKVYVHSFNFKPCVCVQLKDGDDEKEEEEDTEELNLETLEETVRES